MEEKIDKENFFNVKKAIYKFCFKEGVIRNTFKAKNLQCDSGVSSRLIGRRYLPDLIQQGLIRVYEHGNHPFRYMIIRAKWENMNF